MKDENTYPPGEFPDHDDGEWEHGYCDECGDRLGAHKFDDECECWDHYGLLDETRWGR